MLLRWWQGKQLCLPCPWNGSVPGQVWVPSLPHCGSPRSGQAGVTGWLAGDLYKRSPDHFLLTVFKSVLSNGVTHGCIWEPDLDLMTRGMSLCLNVHMSKSGLVISVMSQKVPAGHDAVTSSEWKKGEMPDLRLETTWPVGPRFSGWLFFPRGWWC